MRPHAVALLVLLAILAPAAVQAQAEPAGPVLTDAAGDAQLSVSVAGTAAPGVPLAGEPADGADLLALDIIETEDAVTFSIAVTSLKSNPAGGEYVISFDWNGRAFEAVIGYFRFESGGEASEFRYGYLAAQRGEERDFVARLEVEADRDGGTVSAPVPKVYVMDSANRIPARGESITGLSVTASRPYIRMDDFQRTQIEDRMPDGDGAGEYVFQLGDYATGHLRLNSPDRVRVSNGGATTFVYRVEVHNGGDAEDEVSLVLGDVPADWNVTLQSPVRVPAKGSTTAPVLASIPFGHEHGGFDSFHVIATSRNAADAEASIRLGVLHTPIPQPTGHHSELFLHADDPRSGPWGQVFSTVFPFARGWMNTVADHEGEDPYMTPNSWSDEVLRWYIPLNPRLQLGLDFDLERLGKLTASVAGPASGEGEVSASLYYFRDSGTTEEEILLAEGTSAGVTFEGETPKPFEITLTPTPESDYIAYAQEASMVLVVSLRDTNALPFRINNPQTPRIHTEDFKLSLPLDEYHDRLEGGLEATSAVEIVAQGPVEKQGRPGSVMTYEFLVRNAGSQEDVFVFERAGSDAAYATMVPVGLVQLKAGEERRVTLALAIPPDANDGQTFEVLLFVRAHEDPSKMAIARTQTIATRTGEAAPDETQVLLEAQRENMQTPGAGAATVVLALVAVAALGARRRA